jgi:hypothetical protein
LGLGLSPVVKAELKWIEITKYVEVCFDVCQLTTHFETQTPFAVPAGIHKPTGKTFYVCATTFGYRMGKSYNIE